MCVGCFTFKICDLQLRHSYRVQLNLPSPNTILQRLQRRFVGRICHCNIFADGCILTLEEVTPLLHPSLHFSATSWSFVSQQIHPILQIPYLHLHPCGTGHLLSHLVARDSTPFIYLCTWLQAALSLVFPDDVHVLQCME